MIVIRRTKFSTKMVPIPGAPGQLTSMSPADDMQPCEVSTVDLLPGLAEYDFYQEYIAPLHSVRLF